MNRIVLGALAALLLVAAGLFWWQGRAATERGAPPPVAALASGVASDDLPLADGKGLNGAAPPEADEATREERRFNRFDRNRDNAITRNEMMAPRAAVFRSLDTDHNNLLSFEEWAVKTSDRFKGADRNGDLRLARDEFATTKPKPAIKPQCRCASARPAATHASGPTPGRRPAAKPADPPDDSADDGGEPEL